MKNRLSIPVVIFIISAIIFINPDADAKKRKRAIVIDHTCTDLSKIPAKWINSAKSAVVLHYAHTSHGGQLVKGLSMIKKENSKYGFTSGKSSLPQVKNSLRIFDGQENDAYISPKEYWASSSGLLDTSSVLNNNSEINVSMWSWCCQQNYNSKSKVDRYLNAMSELERKNPGVTFVYMTGNAQSWNGHHQYRKDKGDITGISETNRSAGSVKRMAGFYSILQILNPGIRARVPIQYTMGKNFPVNMIITI